jgi:hypothetical protein
MTVSVAKMFGVLSLLLCLPLAAGCHRSGPTARVDGTVTLDGQPIAKGYVSFQPKPRTPGPEFSGDIVGGKYYVARPVAVGDFRVEVRAFHKTGRKVRGPMNEEVDEVSNMIPKRFWGPDTTLSAHLNEGANTVDFNLKR